MEKYQEYLSFARECETLAASVDDPDLRKQWQRLAETWRYMAGERKETLKLPVDPEHTKH